MVYIENQDSDGDHIYPKALIIPNVDSDDANINRERGTLVFIKSANVLSFVTERDVSVEIVTNT